MGYEIDQIHYTFKELGLDGVRRSLVATQDAMRDTSAVADALGGRLSSGLISGARAGANAFAREYGAGMEGVLRRLMARSRELRLQVPSVDSPVSQPLPVHPADTAGLASEAPVHLRAPIIPRPVIPDPEIPGPVTLPQPDIPRPVIPDPEEPDPERLPEPEVPRPEIPDPEIPPPARLPQPEVPAPEVPAPTPASIRRIADVLEQAYKVSLGRAQMQMRDTLRSIEIKVRAGRISEAEATRARADAEQVYTEVADAAARAFNERLHRRMGAAKMSAADFAHVQALFKQEGRKAGTSFEEETKGPMSRLLSWIRVGVAVQLAQLASQLLGSLTNVGKEAVQLELEGQAATRRMQASSRLYGVELGRMQRTANEARDDLRLMQGQANELADVTTKFAAKAGDASRAQELLNRALDLGAAKRMTAKEVGEALELTLRGQDEGLDRLVGKNPSAIWDEQAAAAGRATSSLSAQEQMLAVLNEITGQGAKVQGEWANAVAEASGELQENSNQVQEAKRGLGASMVSAVVSASDSFTERFVPALQWVTDLLWSMQDPLRQGIALMREMGRTAAEILPAQLRLQRNEARGEIEDLQEDLRQWRQEWTRSNSPIDGAMQMTVDEAEAQLDQVIARLEAGTGSWKDQIRRRALQEFINLTSQLEVQTNRLADAERRLPGAERAAEDARRLRELEEQLAAIDDTAERTGESNGVQRARDALVAEINAERARQGMPSRDADRLIAERLAAHAARAAELDEAKDVAGLRGVIATMREEANALDEASLSRENYGAQIRQVEGLLEKHETAAKRRAEQEATRAAREAETDAKALERDRAAVQEQLAGMLDGLTVTAIDDAEAGLQKFEAEIDRVFGASVPEAVRAGLARVRADLDATRALEAHDRTLSRIVARKDGAGLLAVIGTLVQEREEIEKGTRAHAAYDATIQRATSAYKDLAGGVKEAAVAVESKDRSLYASLRLQEELAATVSEVTRAERLLADAVREHGEDSVQAAARRRELNILLGRSRTLSEQIIDGDRRAAETARQAHTERMSQLREATEAAIDLANAVGLGGGAGVEAFEGVIRLVEAIDRYRAAQESLAGLGALDIGNVLEGFASGVGAISAAISLLKGLGSLLGGGASEEERRRHLEAGERNRDLIHALDSLSSRVTSLAEVSSAQAQRDLASIRDAGGATAAALDWMRGVLPSGPTVMSPNAIRDEAMRRIAVALGLAGNDAGRGDALAALQDWAEGIDERYGSNLAARLEAGDLQGFLAALRQLPAALQDAIGGMGQYADDFAGVIGRINREFSLLEKSDPATKVRRVVAELARLGIDTGEFSDEIAELAGLDLTSTAGRTRREEIMLQVLERLGAGSPDNPVDFGDLTPAELEELLKLFREASNPAGVSGGGNSARLAVAITEVQANQLLEIENTLLILEREKLELQRYLPRIWEALAGTPMGYVPPPLQPPSTSLAAGVTNIYHFNLTADSLIAMPVELAGMGEGAVAALRDAAPAIARHSQDAIEAAFRQRGLPPPRFTQSTRRS